MVFLYVYYVVDQATRGYILGNYVVIPREIVQGQDYPPPGPYPLWLTLFTAMFLHANWLHLLGNMLFLFIFGDNVEDAFGHLGYLLFYFVCGIAASLMQVGVVEAFGDMQGLTTGELGASGAIAGVLGAYLVLFPHARIRTLIGFGLLVFTRLSAAEPFSGLYPFRIPSLHKTGVRPTGRAHKNFPPHLFNEVAAVEESKREGVNLLR